MTLDFSFVLLNFSAILILLMYIFIYFKQNKTQLHHVFLWNFSLLFIWCTSIIVQEYFESFNSPLIMYIDYIAFIGVFFIPVTILLTGIIHAFGNINFTLKYLLLFIVPTISIIILWTNDFHHLFYKKYSTLSSEAVFGDYFIFHTLYSYLCIAVGLFFLLYFSIKSSGLFSKQATLILLGFSVPLVVNVAFTLNLIPLSNHSTPIVFSFLVICCMLATLKFNFLSITPIALRSVVDHISDCFIVLNKNFVVIDYNKTLVDVFKGIYTFEINQSLNDLLKSNENINVDRKDLYEYLNQIMKDRKLLAFEKHIVTENFDKYFHVEITPILSNNKCLGAIILLKDITHLKKSLEIVNENQVILRKERHDFANHLNMLNALCLLRKSDTLDKIKLYLNSLISNSNSSYKLYNTGNTYIDSLLSIKNNLALQKNIHLDANFDFPLSNASVDDVDLTSIMGNIIDNAFDALTLNAESSDSLKKIVSVYSFCEADKCCISISNNGPKIPDTYLEKIFENQFSTKSKEAGERGFGLFITKELVKKNDGEVSVKSTEDGTEFLLQFNISKTANQQNRTP